MVGELWAQLGIGKAISRVAGAGRGRSAAVERAIFAMVCQRCLEPGSKLEATRWVGRDVVIDGVGGVNDDQLYRAMDFLLACSERVQESVFFSVAHLLEPRGRRDLLRHHLDLLRDRRRDPDDEPRASRPATGEARAAEPLRRLGHSKDHRPDLPQVVIGLAVTREGIPVRVLGVAGQHQRPDAWSSRSRATWSAGGWAARSTSSTPASPARTNLRHLRSAGGHYIAGMKLRSGMAETEAGALAPGPLPHGASDNLRVKEVSVGDGEAAERFIVCHNPAEAERDQARREQRIDRIDGRARTPQAAARARQDQARAGRSPARRVRAPRPPDPLALPAPDQDRPARCSTATRSPPRSASTASTCSPPPTRRLTAEDVALGYKQLLEAERSFRDLKGTLALRPVFHRKDDRIRAHVLICFLALVIIRVAETRTGETWRTIRAELARSAKATSAQQTASSPKPPSSPPANASPPPEARHPRTPRFGRITPACHSPNRRRHTRTSRTNPANPAPMRDCRAPEHLPTAELGEP